MKFYPGAVDTPPWVISKDPAIAVLEVNELWTLWGRPPLKGMSLSPYEFMELVRQYKARVEPAWFTWKMHLFTPWGVVVVFAEVPT